jgi:subtilase family serine protease
MKRLRLIAGSCAALLTLGAAVAATAPSAVARGSSAQAACGRPTRGHAQCFALRATAVRGLNPDAVPAGYHPADLASAYGLTGATGTGQTVAIVDAYDNPNAEADLAVYRTQFGLPACTAANGCFKKVNQTGGSTYPAGNVGWGEEISLDLDMVSAICPKCHILLVEATSNSFTNLAAAVNEAAALHATEISNSYGGLESASEHTLAASYKHAGIPITVSTGDGAYPAGTQIPAAFSTVTAVGGTNLKPASNARGWNEKAWFTNTTEGAGSGCSVFILKPTWQKDTGCAKRTVGDVAAVADPATGVSVYDTYGVSGWLVFGGTSASAPIIAGVYALAGNGTAIKNASFIYAHKTLLWDVKKGSTGSCGGSYLCTAVVGYDGPTGLGTPKGITGF